MISENKTKQTNKQRKKEKLCQKLLKAFRCTSLKECYFHSKKVCETCFEHRMLKSNLNTWKIVHELDKSDTVYTHIYIYIVVICHNNSIDSGYEYLTNALPIWIVWTNCFHKVVSQYWSYIEMEISVHWLLSPHHRMNCRLSKWQSWTIQGTIKLFDVLFLKQFKSFTKLLNLKRIYFFAESCHGANFVVTGCQNDNLWCYQ